MTGLISEMQACIARDNRLLLENLPFDYFSWGRDRKHRIDRASAGTEPFANPARWVRAALGWVYRGAKRVLSRDPLDWRARYRSFEDSWKLMGDEYSRNLFVELLVMKQLGEHKFRLSSFTKSHVAAYEKASAFLLASNEKREAYQWILRKTTLDAPRVSMFTAPEVLAVHYLGRLYRYVRGSVRIEVEPGDTVIDAGVGWGDTTVYLAAKANAGSRPGICYAFDILEEGMSFLYSQLELNTHLANIIPITKALGDKAAAKVWISDTPSPAARVADSRSGVAVEATTIDAFVSENCVGAVQFIKMDIEGAELPALRGASKVIQQHKPKLAISVYHKWDDLREIPMFLHSLRGDYQFYLDCTTGFGGEAVLYCR